MKAIILAAGRGSRMGNLTDESPKCLLEIYGKPLIKHQIEAITEAGIREIAIVTGYKNELLIPYGTHHFHNIKWEVTNMVYSLMCAKEWLDTSDCIVSYSDIYYSSKIIKDLVKCSDDIAIAYDPNWLELWSKRFENPLEDAETFRIDSNNYLIEIGKRPKTVEEIEGQYMGLLKFKRGRLNFSLPSNKIEKVDFTNYINSLLNHNKIKAVKNNKNWFEFDSKKDLSLI